MKVKSNNVSYQIPFKRAICEGDSKSVKNLLTAKKVNVDERFQEYGDELRNSTPVFLAIQFGQSGVLKELIANGASISKRMIDPMLNLSITPLLAAIMREQDELADILIDSSNIEELNWISDEVLPSTNYKMNALYAAVFYKRINVVKKLLSKGVDVNGESADPLYAAILVNDEVLITLLLTHGVKISASNCNDLYKLLQQETTTDKNREKQLIILSSLLKEIENQKLNNNEAFQFSWENDAKIRLQKLLDQRNTIKACIDRSINPEGKLPSNPLGISRAIYDYLSFFPGENPAPDEKQVVKEQAGDLNFWNSIYPLL
ncbi:ankyrin repeat domain-containing protein [Legionella waltersii]|uniref:Ankyrin repeats (3 copies) n=1 Tax=Legionella waltersii TaxID=66969 RepID=A0A0W1A0W7_9GAMM|nr:ankyrin repeat domain-containing protein [Legionella waltersii]KTD74989.1 Ankyrin repeats (3 copies) [Legionella waltersii]SNV08266.1 Ribulose-5-phosphate 4-epimerase and related epimerases and aldolases [Legionella waltersii]